MTLAEELAQATLRGWFGDPAGFNDMRSHANERAAVRRIIQVLISHGIIAEVSEEATQAPPPKKDSPKVDGAEQAIMQARRAKMQRIIDRGEQPFAQCTEENRIFNDMWKRAVIEMAEAIKKLVEEKP